MNRNHLGLGLLLVFILCISSCRQRNIGESIIADNPVIDVRTVNSKAVNNKPLKLELFGVDEVLWFSVEPESTGYRASVRTSSNVSLLLDGWSPDIFPLDKNEVIDGSSFYTNGTFILGSSSTSSGIFEGNGFAYLGLRINRPSGYHYAWVSIEVPVGNGNIKVYKYAMNKASNTQILTGQLR